MEEENLGNKVFFERNGSFKNVKETFLEDITFKKNIM